MSTQQLQDIVEQQRDLMEQQMIEIMNLKREKRERRHSGPSSYYDSERDYFYNQERRVTRRERTIHGVGHEDKFNKKHVKIPKFVGSFDPNVYIE